jgi:hypothetical protein
VLVDKAQWLKKYLFLWHYIGLARGVSLHQGYFGHPFDFVFVLFYFFLFKFEGYICFIEKKFIVIFVFLRSLGEDINNFLVV